MKKLKVLLIALLFIPIVVNAKVIEAKQDVKLKGEYNSTKLVLGKDVKNDGTINGLALIFGKDLELNGNVEYGIYAGDNVTIKDTIEKDLFVSGNDIEISEEAIVPRDVFIAANKVNLKTDIGRNVNIIASSVNLKDVTINGTARIYAEKINIKDGFNINGKLIIDEQTEINGNLDGIKVVKKKLSKEEVNVETDENVISDIIVSIITGYVTMLVLLLVIKKFKEKLDNKEIEANGVIKDTAYGFALLISVPIAAILGMITVILLPISLITIPLYIFAIYVSSYVASYVIGRKVWELLKQKSNMYVELLIGIILVKIIGYVPVVGGLVIAVCLFYGLGLIFYCLTNKEIKETKKEEKKITKKASK